MNTIPAPDAYRKRLSEMLDLTYELEGLLHIGVARSSVPPRLNQLIVDKINSLVALADAPAETEGLNSDLDDGYSEIDEDDLMEFPAMTPSAEEEKTAEGEMSEESGYMHGASAEAAEEYVAEPSEIKEEAEQYETAAEEEKIGNTIIDGNIADEEVEDIKEGDIKEGDI
ncbi:MAG: hypothetical protein K2K29_01205, partial [Muribaculaceae bacterium]|nr:hypothetical protein [Muribaculaceae bacterium]